LAITAAASGRSWSAKAKRTGGWRGRASHSSERPSCGPSAMPQNLAEPIACRDQQDVARTQALDPARSGAAVPP